ncbi:hypothetical protein Tco_1518073 [Tanacetum coccineum]
MASSSAIKAYMEHGIDVELMVFLILDQDSGQANSAVVLDEIGSGSFRSLHRRASSSHLLASNLATLSVGKAYVDGVMSGERWVAITGGVDVTV